MYLPRPKTVRGALASQRSTTLMHPGTPTQPSPSPCQPVPLVHIGWRTKECVHVPTGRTVRHRAGSSAGHARLSGPRTWRLWTLSSAKKKTFVSLSARTPRHVARTHSCLVNTSLEKLSNELAGFVISAGAPSTSRVLAFWLEAPGSSESRLRRRRRRRRQSAKQLVLILTSCSSFFGSDPRVVAPSSSGCQLSGVSQCKGIWSCRRRRDRRHRCDQQSHC